MTRLNASLHMVLRNIEMTAQEHALLCDRACLRQAAAGEELYRNKASHADMSLLILVRGRLSITRRPLVQETREKSRDHDILITAQDLPVLVPPPRPSLLVRAETEVEVIEFGDATCALLLGTCRAFRALVFAAANAGVSQLRDGDGLGDTRMERRVSADPPPRILH